MSVPSVSILMTVRDGARYLRPAIASMLNQTHSSLQLVIVDDASQDATPEILASIRDPRVEVHRSDAPLGISEAKMLGLSYATGNYIAMMDADDIALPVRLAVQKAYLEKNLDVGIVGCNVATIDRDGRPHGVRRFPRGPLPSLWRLLIGPPFIHPSVMVRREVLVTHPYRPEFTHAQDYDLWSRALRVTRGANIERPLLLYRSHSGQLSRDSRQAMLLEHDTIARRVIAEELPNLALPATLVSRLWRFMTGVESYDSGMDEIGSAYLRMARAFLAAHRDWDGRDDVLRDVALDVTRRFAPHLRRPAARAVLRELVAMDPLAPLRCAEAGLSATALLLRASSVARQARRHPSLGSVPRATVKTGATGGL